MGQDLTRSVICILGPTGEPVGTGFFIAPDQAVTCAHVVDKVKSGPGQALAFRRYRESTPQAGQVLAEGWSPAAEGDVAFLQVEPAEANEPLRMCEAAQSAGHEYTSFGFPRSQMIDGQWAGDKIRGPVYTRSGYLNLQLRGEEISAGFSGAPVFDETLERVVGMVTWHEDQAHTRIVTAVAADTIRHFARRPDLFGAVAARKPFMVEPLPDNYVERPRETEAIIQALVEEVSGEAQPLVGITAALRGAGGYGKTTLARAVCRDPRIRAAFPDGVLWVTLGEHPSPGELVEKLNGLAAALGGERSSETGLSQAAAALRGLLSDRRALLVIDDAWQREHLEPFLQPGARCACLVTTRYDDTLPAETTRVAVDAMQAEEAQKLLASGLGETRPEPGLAALGVQLGNWPLLLQMANATLTRYIRGGGALEEALRRPREILRLPDFEVSKGAEVSPKTPTQQAFEVAIEQLSRTEQSLFSGLAVFPEDIEIPLAAVATLWAATSGLNERETERLCRDLAERGLILRLDLAAGTILLHDEVRGYLYRQAADRLPRLHRRLVDGYQRTCPGGHWAYGPRDGYFFGRLAYHLAQAGQAEELERLLLDFDWIDAHLRNGGIAELLGDYDVGLAACAGKEALRLVQGALRLSAHVLARDAGQLATHLRGRLLGFEEPAVRKLLEQAGGFQSRPWLRPRFAWLPPPGGPEVRTLAGHSDSVNTVVISPDGHWAVSGSNDRTLKIWDLASGETHRTLAGHSFWVTAMAISPDGRLGCVGVT